MTDAAVDWSKCEDVESVPGKVSGAWVLKGTRVQAQAVVDNARDGFTAEEIATEIFELPLERMRILLDENIPRGLRRILQGHDVRTASEMGWASIANGQLLDEAENARDGGVCCQDRGAPTSA